MIAVSLLEQGRIYFFGDYFFKFWRYICVDCKPGIKSSMLVSIWQSKQDCATAITDLNVFCAIPAHKAMIGLLCIATKFIRWNLMMIKQQTDVEWVFATARSLIVINCHRSHLTVKVTVLFAFAGISILSHVYVATKQILTEIVRHHFWENTLESLVWVATQPKKLPSDWEKFHLVGLHPQPNLIA